MLYLAVIHGALFLHIPNEILWLVSRFFKLKYNLRIPLRATRLDDNCRHGDIDHHGALPHVACPTLFSVLLFFKCDLFNNLINVNDILTE